MITIETSATYRIEKIQNSGISEAFTPSTPVSQNFFCGRNKEVNSILNAVVSSKSHILLYGDRGVGKTSLAKYTCGLLAIENFKQCFIEARCGKDDTFGSVIQSILQSLDKDVAISHTSSTTSNGTLKLVSAGYTTTKEKAVYANFDSPAWAADKLRDLNAIILIDEFDTLRNKADKENFMECEFQTFQAV